MTPEMQPPPDRPDRAAVAFHPPVLLLVLIVLAALEQWVLPVAIAPEAFAQPVGVAIVALALALFAWAVVTMRRGGASIPTNTATDAIVTGGPFRFSRNPIYLSMALLLVGIGFWVNSVWFLFAAVLDAVLLNFYVIAREEDYLAGKFGQTYLAYQRRVRRWI